MFALVLIKNQLILWLTILVLVASLHGCNSSDYSSSINAQTPSLATVSVSENRWRESRPPTASQRNVHREPISMPFIANRGQLDKVVAYYTSIQGKGIFAIKVL